MAIKNIPTIEGPSYGGLIYSLSLDSGYSSSPSSLTLRIVSKSGKYSTPVLNQKVTIKFGSFIFRGTVWSYTFKDDAGESILEVVVNDNSIILDRIYVLLWKRGLLGSPSKPSKKETKFIKLNEKVFIPEIRLDRGTVRLVSKTLNGANVERLRGSYFANRGSYIILGEEDFPDTNCDIPDTKYSFNNLRSLLPVPVVGAPSSANLKNTYEGTLREVLNSWCSDLGFEFYWDYSNDRLVFYNVQSGITSLPTGRKSASIISTSESWSMDGSFAQYGIAYSAQPKSPAKEISAGASLTTIINVPPVHYSQFINKSLRNRTFEDSGTNGTGRPAREILEAALIGYASRPLRDLWIFTKYTPEKSMQLLGYGGGSAKLLDKKQAVEILRLNGYSESIEALESVFGADLPRHNVYLASFNSDIADQVAEGEQETLRNVGKWYRIPQSSRSSFYCSANVVAKIDVSVDPDPTIMEAAHEKFAGKKIYDRGGEVGGDTLGIQDKLKILEENGPANLQNCMPITLSLKETGFVFALLQAKLITEKELEKFNVLVLLPTIDVSKSFIGLDVRFSRRRNPFENTVADIVRAKNESGEPECKDYEEKLAQTACKSAKEEAREKSMKEVLPPKKDDDEVSGLINSNSTYCKISLKGGEAELYAPSDGAYQTVIRWTVDVKKIDTEDTQQKILSSGFVGSADSVAEIRVNIDNVTSFEDSLGNQPPPQATPNIICGPQGSVSYTFAGEPEGVPLSPGAGLTNLNISLGSDGFTTTVGYKTRIPKPAKSDQVLRKANSQLNRLSFNAN
jgi:hypothetical protein